MLDLISNTKSHRKDFTATGYVVNPERTKLLVIFHNKLQKWIPAGGHMEPNELPHEAAIREVFEETGVTGEIISDDHDIFSANTREAPVPRPYAVIYQLIPKSSKDIEHIHVDFIYAMEAEESELNAQLEEVSHAKWMTKEELLEADTFESVKGFVNTFLK